MDSKVEIEAGVDPDPEVRTEKLVDVGHETARDIEVGLGSREVFLFLFELIPHLQRIVTRFCRSLHNSRGSIHATTARRYDA